MYSVNLKVKEKYMHHRLSSYILMLQHEKEVLK
jgi:hypothetical protein